MSEEELRRRFESQNRDSFGFRRSRKGTYVNPAVARDWKWFQRGFAEAQAALQAADALIAAVCKAHDTKEPPLKYATPYGAVVTLGTELNKLKGNTNG